MIQRKRKAPPSSAHHPARPRVFLNRILACQSSGSDCSPTKERSSPRRPLPPNIENPSESAEYDDGSADSDDPRDARRAPPSSVQDPACPKVSLNRILSYQSSGSDSTPTKARSSPRHPPPPNIEKPSEYAEFDDARADSVDGRDTGGDVSDDGREDFVSGREDWRENSDGEREDSASRRGSGSDAGREDSDDSAENINIGGGGESVDDGSGSDAGREDSDDSAENMNIDAVLEPVRGVAVEGHVDNKGSLRKKRVVVVDFSLLSDKVWHVSRHADESDASPYGVMKEWDTDKTFNVHHGRIGKAKLHLSYDHCTNTTSSDACECSKKCHRTFLDPADVQAIRAPVFTKCDSQAAVVKYLTANVTAHNGRFIVHNKNKKPKKASARGKVSPDAGGTQVCRRYYARLHGVAETTLRTAKKLAVSSSKPPEKRSPPPSERKKYDVAYAFWYIFFEQHCQRPNGDIRLFPVAKSMRDVRSEYFLPWHTRLCTGIEYNKKDLPGFTTWSEARWDDAFRDVKCRAKHTHSRCGVCETLKALLLKSFQDGAMEREYMRKRRLHDTEVTEWRKLESVVKAMAVSSPADHLVIMHDGTSSLGLPRLSHRSIKNLDPLRFEVTPWLAMDYSKGLKDYIYSPSANTPKDANTLISQIHIVIRRAKSDYNHPRHRARTLTLVADSASENKNNTLFAYCNDLVHNGWFDEIILIFGPVGHTHNGVDASHKVHNQNVAGHVSGDLGHFVQNYVKGFSGTNSEGQQRPKAHILERTLDWTKYYAPYLRRVSGFCKSKNDAIAIRGFRIAKNKHGAVDLTWKTDPALEKHWKGASGFDNTDGFYILTGVPEGVPDFVPTKVPTPEYKKKMAGLKSANMKAAMAPQGLTPCVEWNFQASITGKIPIHSELENETPPGEWGPLCEVGAVPGKRGQLRVIRDYWDMSRPHSRRAMWSLPHCPNSSHIAAISNQYHFAGDQDILNARPLPRFRYNDESRNNCEVARHHNNLGPGWRPDVAQHVPEEPKDTSSDEDLDNPEPEGGPNYDDHGWVREDAAEDNASEGGAEEGTSKPAAAVMRFEEDFNMCKRTHFCVGLAETTKGPSPYIFVGKITHVDPVGKTLNIKPLHCTEDTWSKDCLHGGWFIHPQDPTQNQPHYAIMGYAKKLNRNNKLPRALINKVEERTNIVWHKE